MLHYREERDYNRAKAPCVEIHYIGWSDVIDLIDNRLFNRSPLVREFASFAAKGFNVRRQREVLIQDLSKPDEVARYARHQVYRRDVTFGSPLYFAPYLTRNAVVNGDADQEGISSLSRVLGVLTVKGQDVRTFNDELRAFAKAQEETAAEQTRLVNKWLGGVDQNSGEEFTHFFLGNPVDISPSLRKDGGIEKGRGKNWIAGKIPKNRCVTFAEFTRRVMIASQRTPATSE